MKTPKYEGYEGEMMFTYLDLSKLMGGTVSDRTVYKHHLNLRKGIIGDANRGAITILEFCKYKGFDYAEIYFYLRGKEPLGMAGAEIG